MSIQATDQSDHRAVSKIMLVVPPLVDYDDELDKIAGPDFEKRRLVSPIDPTTSAAVLKQRGYTVNIFDMGVYTASRERHVRVREAIEEFRPDAIAIVQSILTFATAQDWDGSFVFEIAREINPDTTTILTGTHATNYPGRAVGEKTCDFSIRGEVEFALADLLDCVNAEGDLSKIAGLAYRDAESGDTKVAARYPQVELEDLPAPDYMAIQPKYRQRYSEVLERGKIRYPQKSPHYRDIMTSRSCILRCSFCSVAHLRGPRQKYRRKPSDLVIREIGDALDQGIQEIHFFDDLFAANVDEIYGLVNEIAKRNWKFDWMVAQGLNLWFLDEDVIKAMAETGMYRLIAPFESGSDRVLKEVVGKIHSTVDKHHDVAVWTAKAGVQLIGMFVVGLQSETRSELLATVQFAEDHPEIDYSVFSIATPMIGTRMTKKALATGILKDEEKVNNIIKRTVALYRTEEFSEYELGVIRSYDWDRINFGTAERRAKYASMVGISLEELDELRDHSINTFKRFFPDFSGPYSFKDLYAQPGLYEVQPEIVASA